MMDQELYQKEVHKAKLQLEALVQSQSIKN